MTFLVFYFKIYVSKGGGIMKYDNFYVSNLIISSYLFGDVEKCFLLESRICRKTKKGYVDIETHAFYSSEQTRGIDRIDQDSLVPLNSYYNTLGFKKKNHYANQNEVYQKVKHLKSQRKI